MLYPNQSYGLIHSYALPIKASRQGFVKSLGQKHINFVDDKPTLLLLRADGFYLLHPFWIYYDAIEYLKSLTHKCLVRWEDIHEPRDHDIECLSETHILLHILRNRLMYEILQVPSNDSRYPQLLLLYKNHLFLPERWFLMF